MQTILLIEDNFDIQDNLKECLELKGYNILVASNGKKAIDLLSDGIPDLIICDIMMPVMDGYEVLRLIRSKVRTAGIPFIYSTSNSEKKAWTEAIALGADDIIIKPYDPDILIKMVEELIYQHEVAAR